MSDWMDEDVKRQLDAIRFILENHPDQEMIDRILEESIPKDLVRRSWKRIEEMRRGGDYCLSADAEEVYQRCKDDVEEYLET